MSKTNACENSLLLLIFIDGQTFANIGDAGGLLGTSDAGAADNKSPFYMSLHSSSPGETGDQSTNEISYTGYSRSNSPTSSGARRQTTTDASSCPFFTISGNQVTLGGGYVFPACTGGTATATHWGLGSNISGSGRLMYYGALNSSLSISSGIVPAIFEDVIITED